MLTYDRCRKSTVLHVKRHRDIATLVQGILELDDAQAGTSPLINKTRKTRKDDESEVMKLDTGIIDESGESEDWPDTSTVCDDDVDGQIFGLAETKEKLDFKKPPKAERKTAKNKSRFQVTTAEELQRIQDALHPARDPLSNKGGGYLESNSLINNATIDTNIAFNSHTFQYSSLRSGVQKRKLEKYNGLSTPRSRAPLNDSQMSAILHRLGISSSAVSNNTKERTSRIISLRGAIEKDLGCVENEDRETMARMAGYWRYANRRTYNAMVRTNELWDWATGAKLEEIEEEESELGSTDEEEDQRSPGFSESDTIIGAPQCENWDNDFVFDSNDPLHLATMPEGVFEQHGGQMLDDRAFDFAEKSPWSVIPEEALVPGTPVKRAAMISTGKENASPWAGIKDTRRQPRRSTSPPSPRKRFSPRTLSPPSLRLSSKNPTSHRPRRNTLLGASPTTPTARTRKSLTNHLADFHFPPKGAKTGRIPPRCIKTDLLSIAAAATPSPSTNKRRLRFPPDPINPHPLTPPRHISPDPAHDDNPTRAPDPNNRFSPLVCPEYRQHT